MTTKQEVVIQGDCVTSKRGHHKLSYYEQNSSKYNLGQIWFIAIDGDPILKQQDLVLSMFLIFVKFGNLFKCSGKTSVAMIYTRILFKKVVKESYKIHQRYRKG